MIDELGGSKIEKSDQQQYDALQTEVQLQRTKLSKLEKDLKLAIKEARAAARDTRHEMSDNRSLMVFGFMVLLVMVATMLVMVLTDWKNSNNDLVRAMSTEGFARLATSSTPNTDTEDPISDASGIKIWGSKTHIMSTSSLQR